MTTRKDSKAEIHAFTRHTLSISHEPGIYYLDWNFKLDSN